MDSIAAEKPHVVMVPYPAQGHITPMLKVAKLLHSRGFHVTFVNTEYNHQRLVRSCGPDAVRSLDDFKFDAIPDGLPPSDDDVTQDVPALNDSICKNFLGPLRQLLARLAKDSSVPAVTCIVSDGLMSFTLDAAKELRVPCVMLWTSSACGLIACLYVKDLIEKGLLPLKSIDDITNGYLNMLVDCIPGANNMRLCDFPSFIRTTDPNDTMFKFLLHVTERITMASAVIFNTFDALEQSVLHSLSKILPPIYTIGPLHLLTHQLLPPESELSSLSSSLWKEERSYFNFLEGKEAGSVVYVNFGSITVMTNDQLIEFAWGLANSNMNFLWVIRPDLVRGDDAVLPQEFLVATEKRGLLASWCPQEEVISHPAIGGFLTHCGWNSALETISAGIPVVCWPFFAEQQTNCRYLCTEWGIGMEIDNNVKRDEVAELIKELMGGDKGKEMKRKALEWKESVLKAVEVGGSSYENFEKLLNEVLLPSKNI